jgi:hypothetical protein
MRKEIRRLVKTKAKANANIAIPGAPARYYTRKEIAALAGVCVHTVAKDAKAGLLQETRFNARRVRSHSNAVKTYLAAEFDVALPVKPALSPTRQPSKAAKAPKSNMALGDGLDIKNSKVAKPPKSAVLGAETAMPDSQVIDSQQKTQATGTNKPIMKFCRSRGENTPVCHFPTPSAECLDSGGRLDGCPFLAIYLILFSRTLPLPASLYLREGSHIKIINN